MIKRKRIFLIATFVLIAAIGIVLWVSLLNKGKVVDFDGTLVHGQKIVQSV